MCLAGLTEVVAPAPAAQAPPMAMQQAQFFDAMIKAAQGGAPQQVNLDRGFPEMYAASVAGKTAVQTGAPQQFQLDRGFPEMYAPSQMDKTVFQSPAPLPPTTQQPHALPACSGPAATDEAKDNHALDKTKLCKFFLKGQCRRGSTCTFAHGRRQLRPQPDLFRTQLCIDFVNGGSCSFGASCRYAHNSEELRVPDLKASKAAATKRKAAPAAVPTVPAAPAPPAPHQPPGGRSSAEALARELECVQQQAQRLQEQLLALQRSGAGASVAKDEESVRAPRRTTQPPAEIAISEARADDRSSDISTSPGMSRRMSVPSGWTPPESMASPRNGEANSWGASSSSGGSSVSVGLEEEAAEPLVEVVVRVRNTFVDMTPAEPSEHSLRRVSSAPALQ